VEEDDRTVWRLGNRREGKDAYTLGSFEDDVSFLEDLARTFEAFGIVGITGAFSEQHTDAGRAGSAGLVVSGDRMWVIRSGIDNMHSDFIHLEAGDLMYVSFHHRGRGQPLMSRL
jgi:hypothetical protein